MVLFRSRTWTLSLVISVSLAASWRRKASTMLFDPWPVASGARRRDTPQLAFPGVNMGIDEARYDDGPSGVDDDRLTARLMKVRPDFDHLPAADQDVADEIAYGWILRQDRSAPDKHTAARGDALQRRQGGIVVRPVTFDARGRRGAPGRRCCEGRYVSHRCAPFESYDSA